MQIGYFESVSISDHRGRVEDSEVTCLTAISELFIRAAKSLRVNLDHGNINAQLAREQLADIWIVWRFGNAVSCFKAFDTRIKIYSGDPSFRFEKLEDVPAPVIPLLWYAKEVHRRKSEIVSKTELAEGKKVDILDEFEKFDLWSNGVNAALIRARKAARGEVKIDASEIMPLKER